MVTRDDIKFKQQKLQFEAAVKEAEDDYAVRDLATDYFPKVLTSNVSDAQKVAELEEILRYVEIPAAEKLSEDIEKGVHWQSFEIAANNEGIINKLLENIIKLTPQGHDDKLMRLARQIAVNNDGGNRYMQYENPTCLRLMNMAYEKLNDKNGFQYLDLIAAYQQFQAEEKAKQKTQTREEKRQNERQKAYSRLDEIKEQLKTDISPIDKLNLLDEAIELSSQKYFSPSTANRKRTGYCEHALEICRQELPLRKDLEYRYEDLLKRYTTQKTHIKPRARIATRKSVGVFIR
jgi:hypothetical protein